MKQGTLSYLEYDCPCKGRVNRRKAYTFKKGFFFPKVKYVYYYECTRCGKLSDRYETDISDRIK